MKARPGNHDDELNEDEDWHQEELAALRVFFEELFKPVLHAGTLVEGHQSSKVQSWVAAVHERLCKDRVNLPRLHEDRGEHERRPEAAEELEEHAGLGAQWGVEEQHARDLTQQGPSKQEGKVMQSCNFIEIFKWPPWYILPIFDTTGLSLFSSNNTKYIRMKTVEKMAIMSTVKTGGLCRS